MRLLLIFLSLSTLQSACVSQKAYTSATPLSQVKDIHMFEPLAFISLIEKGNQMAHSDSLSNYFSQRWSLIAANIPGLPVEGLVKIPGFVETEVLKTEIDQLFFWAEEAGGRNLNPLELPPNLVATMDHHNQRFYMLTLSSGFTRREGNYTGQLVKGVALTFLTMGIYSPMPLKANSAVQVMILDNQLGEITFYKNSFNPEGEPLENKTLLKHAKFLFKGYFW